MLSVLTGDLKEEIHSFSAAGEKGSRFSAAVGSCSYKKNIVTLSVLTGDLAFDELLER